MEKFQFITDKNFSELPKTNGVYCFASPKPNGEGGFDIVYIGKAINIQSRVKNHFQQPSYRDNLYIDKVNKIGYLETNSEIEALILEANLIKKIQPKFNVVWRDDKNYFYVAISQNEQKIPYIFITHQPKKLEIENWKLKISYIGPFVEGTALKMTLKFLRKAFPYYTTKNHPKTKCTYCHLDLCPGPNPDLKEYQKNIKKLILILEGKSNTVLTSLKKEMTNFSKQNNFEKAGKIRDKISSLQQVMSHAKVIENEQNKIVSNLANDKFLTISSWDKTQKILRGLVDLNKKISRIECYDISNIQGKHATGSMVVFINGTADKSQYRKFKIHPIKYRETVISPDGKLFDRVKIENIPNDIAMLEEIITRRLLHKEWDYPEIMLIDGGIAQLNIAIKVENLNPETKKIKIISIAKKNKDLYIEGREGFIPLKSLQRGIYNLVLQLDDEAHRFAIAYHKKLRKNSLLKQ